MLWVCLLIDATIDDTYAMRSNSTWNPSLWEPYWTRLRTHVPLQQTDFLALRVTCCAGLTFSF